MSGRWLDAAKALLIPASGLVLFEAWFHGSGRVSDTLAPPSAALRALGRLIADGSLLETSGQTGFAVLSGLAIGVGLGLLFGLALGFSRRLDETSRLAIEMLRSIPSVALLPLALMIFGFGNRMEIFVVAFATFWPFLILTYSAVRQVEPRLIEVARALGFNRSDTALKIVLPAAAPRLMTALRLAAGIALVVAVTCEIASNPQGLGHALMLAQETLRPDDMFAYLFWVGIIGYGVNTVLLVMERRLFSHRGDYDATIAS